LVSHHLDRFHDQLQDFLQAIKCWELLTGRSAIRRRTDRVTSQVVV
jgi:hypothetical protein